MLSKKILIVTHGFYPEQSPRSFRATELAKEFCRQGHQVTVMAPYRVGTDKLAKEFGFDYKSLGELTWRIYNFKSFGIVGRLYNKAVNRFIPLLFEYPKLELFFKVRNALKDETNPFYQLISIAVPYPIHWGVASVWKVNANNLAKIWVADCGDPFMGDESDSFKHPFYFKYIEKWFCRKATYLTVPTENSYKGYYKEFWYKIKVIPQGFKFEDVNIAYDKHSHNYPTFGYAGGVIPNYREPFDFLEYLCEIELDFKFIIYTKNKKYFEKFKSKLRDKLIINELDDRLNVLYEFSKFDFVVNFNNKGNKQTASKLIDYHIIGKPILNIEFRNFNSVVFDQFVLGDYSNAFEIKNPDQYRIENVAKKFIDLSQI